jgi:hypothetical protein
MRLVRIAANSIRLVEHLLAHQPELLDTVAVDGADGGVSRSTCPTQAGRLVGIDQWPIGFTHRPAA